MRKHRHYRFIDLFAGIGGIRLGFERCGNQCVFTSEWDADARKTYSANWPGEKIAGDITKVDPKEIPDFDILCGGFPCQPFSAIGKRQGFSHPTQGTLFFNVRNILLEKKPAAFLLENVPGLVTHDKGKTFKVVMRTLTDELDYDVTFMILDAADFGVPQYRKRAFFIGFKKSLNAIFPEIIAPTALRHADIQDFLETDDAIRANSSPNYKSHFAITKHLQQVYIWKKDDGHPQVVNKAFHGPVKTLCASYHKIQRITGTFVEGGDTGLRLLTELECKRIQGFPDDFKIPVCRTSMYHQFGNSVAVPVIEAIAKEMTHALNQVHHRESCMGEETDNAVQ